MCLMKQTAVATPAVSAPNNKIGVLVWTACAYRTLECIGEFPELDSGRVVQGVLHPNNGVRARGVGKGAYQSINPPQNRNGREITEAAE
jgi:hypothetical protein